jgi:hypothetical protein
MDQNLHSLAVARILIRLKKQIWYQLSTLATSFGVFCISSVRKIICLNQAPSYFLFTSAACSDYSTDFPNQLRTLRTERLSCTAESKITYRTNSDLQLCSRQQGSRGGQGGWPRAGGSADASTQCCGQRGLPRASAPSSWSRQALQQL